MAKGAANHTMDETLDRIHTQLTELRQTEALEAQIHDMVMSKRHRLDGLMGEFLRLAGEEAAVTPVAAAAPIAVAPAAVPVPVTGAARAIDAVPVAPVVPVVSEVKPAVLEEPSTALPLATLPPLNGPRDLLQANGNGGQHAALPTPSAQQVLDSLNRLMSGLKEISSKQSNAPQA